MHWKRLSKAEKKAYLENKEVDNNKEAGDDKNTGNDKNASPLAPAVATFTSFSALIAISLGYPTLVVFSLSFLAPVAASFGSSTPVLSIPALPMI